MGKSKADWKKNPILYTEEYVVKFWLTPKDSEYTKQVSASVFFNGKSKHKKAEELVLNKYRGRGNKVSIISVTYQ
jgi:hypothetical protein